MNSQPMNGQKIFDQSTSQDKALRISNISVGYQTSGFGGLGSKYSAVLKNLSIDLMQAEVLSVLGQSGSGKTTLARAILRQVAISSGEIYLGDRLVQSGEAFSSGKLRSEKRALRRSCMKPGELRRHIQLVPQGTMNNLVPGFTVERHICDILKRRALSASEIQSELDRLLDLSGLDSGFLDRRPSALSGGQRQRLLIAKALAMNPSLLILDEPVASLDVSIQARILNTLKRLQRATGLSMIFITHDLDIAEYIGDRMAIIHEGEIIESGPVDQIVKSPGTAYARTLLHAGLGKSNWLKGNS